jgi:hypothetical protein
MYFQILFAMDRIKALAPEHPGWKTQQPFKAVLDNDMKELAKHGVPGILEFRWRSANDAMDRFQHV